MSIIALSVAADALAWKQAASNAVDLYESMIEPLMYVNDAISDLPRDGFQALWACKAGGYSVQCLPTTTTAEKQAWADALQGYQRFSSTEFRFAEPTDRENWIKVAFRDGQRDFLAEKQAASNVVRGVLKGLGHAPSSFSKFIPGGPGPLVGTLTGGLAGAALGYGAGWLGEKLLPEGWERGRLRRTLATLGGVAGAAPGALMTLNNYQNDRPLNSPAMFADDKYAAARDKLLASLGYKLASSQTGYDVDLEPLPEISVDDFKNTVWRDPLVSQQLGVPLRAASVGLLESAWYARNLQEPQTSGPRLVRPRDIARITAGMGSGYFSGALVGKALGALMGMPQEVQDRLKQTGMWAGVVANMIPLAFGAR